MRKRYVVRANEMIERMREEARIVREITPKD